jgi:hypothetical protein
MFHRFGHKRGRQINLLVDQKFFEFCQLRSFKLDFTGEKLTCITQSEKARQLAAKTAAEQAKQRATAGTTSNPNRMTYGQFRRQADGDYGKRPRN